MRVKLLAALAAVRHWGSRYRLWIAGVMAMALVFGVIVSVRAHSISIADLSPTFLLLNFFVLTPALVAINAAALMFSARAVGSAMSFGVAMTVTSAGVIAGLLPSGSTLTRSTALYASGLRIRDAVGLVTATTVIWIALGFVAGAYVMRLAGLELWIVPALVGLIVAAAGVGYVALRAGVGWALLLAATRLLAFLLTAARIWAAFAAISAPIAPLDAVVFNAAAIIGSSVVIVPSGLGVVETFGALLAPLAGAAAAAAFTALALARVMALLFTGLVTIAAVLRQKGMAFAKPPIHDGLSS